MKLSYNKMTFALSSLFRSLEGSWTFQRQITSRFEGAPSGQVDGTATFSILPSPGKEDQKNDYLYSEVGTMALGDLKQKSFEVRNKYIWTYDQPEDKLNVFFEEDGSRAHLFNTLRFLPESSEEEMPIEFEKLSGWRAISDHLCGSDIYKSHYLFQFDNETQRIKRMDIIYNVLGPRKDYTSETTYFPNCLS